MSALRTPARSKSDGISEEFPQGISEGNFGAKRGNFVSGGFMRVIVFVALGILLILAGGVVAQDPIGFATFEFQDPLDTPDDSWYDTEISGSGGSLTISALWGAGGSGQSARFVANGVTFAAGFDYTPNFDLCDNLGPVSFSLNSTEWPSPEGYVGFGNTVSNGAPLNSDSSGFYLRVSSAGAVTANYQPQSAVAEVSANLGLTLQNNTQYNFVMKDFDCVDPGGFTLQEITSESSVTVSGTGGISTQTPHEFMFAPDANPMTWETFVDNINVTEYISEPAGGVSELNSINYGNLTDVDASPSRGTFVVRYSDGANVATVSAGGLSEIANVATGCLVNGGISTTDLSVVRFDCDGGGTPDEFVITDLDLTGFTNVGCGSDPCDTRVGVGGDTDVVEIEILEDANTYNLPSSPTINSRSILKFGFTTSDTSFHPARAEWENFTDIADSLELFTTTVSYGSTPPANPCIVRTTIWVSGAELRGYDWDDDQSEPGFGSDDGGTEKGVTITNTGWSPISFADCGFDFMAAKSGANVVKIDLSDNANILTVPSSDCGTTAKGFAMSADGNFLACANGNIINFTSGEITGTFTPRAGAHVRLYMDRFAQNLWHVTDTGITRYEIYNVTTIDPVGGSGPAGPTPTTTPPGLPGGGGTGTGNDPDNAIGAIKSLIDDAWGWDPLVSDWIFTMIIIGFTVMFAAVKLGGSPIVIALFALLGTGVAMAFGYMGVWLILVIIFIFIALAGRRMFGGGDTEAT